MRLTRLVPLCLLAVAVVMPLVAEAQPQVPFKGTWTGVTVAADPTNFPVVAVLSEGEGQATQLGQYTMVSPHTSHVFTGETLGDQIFTAANGDTLTAYCAGFALPQDDGSVVGTLDCTFTSGTGRFDGATGEYEFFLVAVPRTDGGVGFATVAEINGSIASLGSRRGGR